MWIALAIAPLVPLGLAAREPARLRLRGPARRHLPALPVLEPLLRALHASFCCCTAYGAHYTYSETAFGFWLRDTLDLARNPYDRIVHFAFGLLLTYPAARARRSACCSCAGVWAYLVPFLLMLAMSAGYESIESWVARIVSPELGSAYLGTQGDEWDAQRDMDRAMTGALICLGAHLAGRAAARARGQARSGRDELRRALARTSIEPAPLLAAVYAAWGLLYVWRTSFVLDGQRVFVLWDDAMISLRYAQQPRGRAGPRLEPGRARAGHLEPRRHARDGGAARAAGRRTAREPALPARESGAAARDPRARPASRARARPGRRPGARARGGDRRALRAALDLVAPGLRRRARSRPSCWARSCVSARALRARRGPSRAAWAAARASASCSGSTSPSCSRPASASRCSRAAAPGARRPRARRCSRSASPAILAFGRLYYGDPLPNTFYLKATGAPIADVLANGGRQLWGMLTPLSPLLLGIALAGLWLLRARSALRARGALRAGALRLRPRRGRRLAQGLSQPLRGPGRDALLRAPRGRGAGRPRALAPGAAPRGARPGGSRSPGSRCSAPSRSTRRSPPGSGCGPTTPTLWWQENRANARIGFYLREQTPPEHERRAPLRRHDRLLRRAPRDRRAREIRSPHREASGPGLPSRPLEVGLGLRPVRAPARRDRRDEPRPRQPPRARAALLTSRRRRDGLQFHVRKDAVARLRDHDLVLYAFRSRRGLDVGGSGRARRRGDARAMTVAYRESETRAC